MLMYFIPCNPTREVFKLKKQSNLPQPGFIHWLGVRLIRIWLLISGSHITGRDYVPSDGACIICPNHLKFMDPFFIGSATRRPIRFVSKKENFRGFVLDTLMSVSLAIELDRESPKPSQIKEIMAVLRNGQMLGIFPEGTRNKVGGLLELHPGASSFARKFGAPIIPVHIKWRGIAADIAFGVPILPGTFQTDDAMTLALRQSIIALARTH